MIQVYEDPNKSLKDVKCPCGNHYEPMVLEMFDKALYDLIFTKQKKCLIKGCKWKGNYKHKCGYWICDIHLQEYI